MENIAKFIFELGMLKKTPRTGYQFLGRGGENVAAHSFRTAMIAFILARLHGQADVWRTVALALVHDLAEARTGDHNYVNRRYIQVDELKVAADQVQGLPFGQEVLEYLSEFEAAETIEAQLARDADQLDLIYELKAHHDLGNSYAVRWIKSAAKRLLTPWGQKMADQALKTDWTAWWFNDKDQWWVDGCFNREEK